LTMRELYRQAEANAAAAAAAFSCSGSVKV
jgi:hypothetical protein